MFNSSVNKKIESLLDAYHAVFSNDTNAYYFPSDRSEGLLALAEKDYAERVLDGTKDSQLVVNSLFRFARYYISYMHYAVVGLNDSSLALNNIATYTQYGSDAIKTAFSLYPTSIKYATIEQNRIPIYLSSMMILGWWKTLEDNVGRVHQGISSEHHCFLKLENSLVSPVLWFTLELQSKVDAKLHYPKSISIGQPFMVYQKVLDCWDTTDLMELNQLVHLLCEAHIELTDESDPFSDINEQLYPYEIFAWLSIRKKQKIINSDSFDHPLMNTPLAKFLLNINLSAENLNEVPYSIALQTTLQKELP